MTQTPKEVHFFGKKHDFLFSNLSAHAVSIDGTMYSTAEHAYQASKFLDGRIRSLVARAISARVAKDTAHAHDDEKREDWYDIKIDVMTRIVRAKVEQHRDVRTALLETGDAIIIETAPQDAFWGWGPDKKGQNELGKIFMKIRTELQ